MNVSVVHAEVLPIPPVLGGAIGQIVFETMQAMPDITWQVISRWDDVLQHHELDDRFVYVDIDARLALSRKVLKGSASNWLSAAEMRQFCYVDGAAEILCEAEPDIVQVENRPAFVPYLKKRLPNTGFVLFMHNEADFSDTRVLKAIEVSDRLIFVSQFLADRYCEHLPQCEKKSTVVSYGINGDVWHARLEKHAHTLALRRRYHLKAGRTVLFVGRMAKEKGLHCLLRAMDVVGQKLPDAKLVVVGSPLFGAVAEDDYTKQLKQQARGLGDRIIFTGFVDRKLLPFYFAAADVVVVPSLFHDPLPTVVLEALACGVPVVGSRRGGIPEMVRDGKWGTLIDNPYHVQDLAHQIFRILNDPKLREQLGKRAKREIPRRFSQKKRLEKMRALYQSFF